MFVVWQVAFPAWFASIRRSNKGGIAAARHWRRFFSRCFLSTLPNSLSSNGISSSVSNRQCMHTHFRFHPHDDAQARIARFEKKCQKVRRRQSARNEVRVRLGSLAGCAAARQQPGERGSAFFSGAGGGER